MAVYQGSLTVKRRPKDGVPGNPGIPGLPGQVPIQKEWVVGDTHRFNDEIKDFIYVRGTSSDTSYWYTRTNKGDVVAGSPPVGGANVEGYTRVDWLRTLAVNVLLAEEANLANFVFKDGKLLSIAGTVNGVPATYTGQAGFVPNITLDGQTGAAYFGANKIMFNPDGSGQLADGNISWNENGEIEFEGASTGTTSRAIISNGCIKIVTDWILNEWEVLKAEAADIEDRTVGPPYIYKHVLRIKLSLPKNADAPQLSSGELYVDNNGFIKMKL